MAIRHEVPGRGPVLPYTPLRSGPSLPHLVSLPAEVSAVGEIKKYIVTPRVPGTLPGLPPEIKEIVLYVASGAQVTTVSPAEKPVTSRVNGAMEQPHVPPLLQRDRNVVAESSIAEQDPIVRKNLANLTSLFETHFDRIVHYIGIRIGSIDDAEDLASEVFAKAVRSIVSYRDTGAPMEAWLFRIARNRVVDYLRDRGRKPSPMPLIQELVRSEHLLPDESEGSELDILADMVPGMADEQHDLVVNRYSPEEIASLRRAMGKLSENHKQVLALRFGADMTPIEVAQVLGRTQGAVRTMQSSAIKKLRESMGVQRK